jgi:hypothetical protein
MILPILMVGASSYHPLEPIPCSCQVFLIILCEGGYFLSPILASHSWVEPLEESIFQLAPGSYGIRFNTIIPIFGALWTEPTSFRECVKVLERALILQPTEWPLLHHPCILRANLEWGCGYRKYYPFKELLGPKCPKLIEQLMLIGHFSSKGVSSRWLWGRSSYALDLRIKWH